MHAAAAVAAVFGTVFLALMSPTWGIRFGAIVFGLAMVALYTTSALYHAVPWRVVWKKRMQRLDHSMILVLIAGTYTPVVIVTLGGTPLLAALVVAWGLVAVGAAQHIFFPRENQTFSMILAISMGWLGIAIAWEFVKGLGWTGAGFGIAGGVVYSIGMLLLVFRRPRLWPRVFSYHEVFHVMVVTASVIHFVMILRYVLPQGI